MTSAVSVISVATDGERRARFTRDAAGAEVKWRFFDACTRLTPSLRYAAEDATVAFGRRLSPGELGCYASHFSLWEELLASDRDQMIVLEDDTLVDWRFLRTLIDIDFDAQGIHFLKLFARLSCPSKLIRWEYIEPSRALIQFRGYALGTQAYVITRKGAAALVEHCRRVRRPIDLEMERSWVHGLPTFAVFPYPVIELSSPSRIGARNVEEPLLRDNLLFRSRRVASRAIEKARRAAALLQPTPQLTLL
jgi:glycosyl transferase family 25